MRYLVVDIGSGSVKIYLAALDDRKRFTMEEADRFETGRTSLEGHTVTNVFAVYDRICEVIRKLGRKGIKIDAMGIDSWCSDYGILDMDSGAVTIPVFYRDPRTDGYGRRVEQVMDYREIYRLTTQRRIENSTLCQLLAYRDEYPRGLDGAKKLLFIGDLLMYLFTGKLCSEVSVASYSQLYSTERDMWAEEILEAYQLPKSLMPPVVPAGTVLGNIRRELRSFLGIGEVKVVAPAVHDTSSAAVTVPAGEGENWAFLATGSWFLMSMETEQVYCNEAAYRYQLTSTGLAFGNILLKKNITAMWLLQECKRKWDEKYAKISPEGYSYAEIAKMAEEAEAFAGIIDTEYEGFVHPADMVEEIRGYLARTGQKVPEYGDIGQITRIIYESIALQSKRALEMLREVTGKQIDLLYIIGGANRVSLLNQLIADAAGIPVRVGPSEATAVGNALLQAYGMGQVESEEEIRKIVREYEEIVEYYPKEEIIWKENICAGLRRLGMEK